jgi:hypothetical protein
MFQLMASTITKKFNSLGRLQHMLQLITSTNYEAIQSPRCFFLVATPCKTTNPRLQLILQLMVEQIMGVH